VSPNFSWSFSLSLAGGGAARGWTGCPRAIGWVCLGEKSAPDEPRQSLRTVSKTPVFVLHCRQLESRSLKAAELWAVAKCNTLQSLLLGIETFRVSVSENRFYTDKNPLFGVL